MSKQYYNNNFNLFHSIQDSTKYILVYLLSEICQRTKEYFLRQNFSLEVIKTEAKFVLSEQLWNTRGEYRVFFFLIKSGQSKRWQTSTGVMLFIWESQRLYLQKKISRRRADGGIFSIRRVPLACLCLAGARKLI